MCFLSVAESGNRGCSGGGGRLLLSASLRVAGSTSLKSLLEQVKSLLNPVAYRVLSTHPNL